MNEATENTNRIAEKALKLFMQFGSRSVSMDDIAEALGISKKTIYQYYADKDALVSDVVNNILQHNCDECEADKNKALNAIHEGFLAINQTTEFFGRINPVFVYDLKKYHPKAYKTFIDFKSDYLFNIIKTNIEWGVREGLYRQDLNIDILSVFRVESILIPFLPDFYSKIKSSIADAHQEVFCHFLYGIATQKGVALIDKYKKEFLKNKSDEKN